MSLIEKIDKNRLPRHVAIIMDGNGHSTRIEISDVVHFLYRELESSGRRGPSADELAGLCHSPGDSGHDEEKRSPYRHRRSFPFA